MEPTQTQEPSTDQTTTTKADSPAAPEQQLMFSDKPAEGADAAKPVDNTKPAEGEKPPAEEVKYEFKAPEDMPIAPEHSEWLAKVAKENNLSPEKAQVLVDKFVEIQKQQYEAVATMHKEWKDSLTNDPKLGGANLSATVAAANRIVATYGDDEFKGLLVDYGLGNHPAVARFLTKINADLKEDSASGKGSSGTQQQEDPAEILFPNMKKSV